MSSRFAHRRHLADAHGPSSPCPSPIEGRGAAHPPARRGAGRLRRGAAAAALVGALAVAGTLSGCGSWGHVAQSALDRLISPEVTMYAPAPDAESFVDSYGDATGAGSNYVYQVPAATEDGGTRTLTLIYFGRKADDVGWLEIDAQGSSGVHYRSIDEEKVPEAAVSALAEDDA